jgi:Asp-tRNA(Asn)/Glu-tRNA(Gln) amidotransferase B subunit
MDELHERINDYIYFSCCDIDPTKASQKVLRAFNRECDELEARYKKEIRELEKIAGKEEDE